MKMLWKLTKEASRYKVCHYIHSLPDGSKSGGAQGAVNHDGSCGKRNGGRVFKGYYQAHAAAAGAVSFPGGFPVPQQLSGT